MKPEWEGRTIKEGEEEKRRKVEREGGKEGRRQGGWKE